MLIRRIGFIFLLMVLIPFGARPASEPDTARSFLHINFNPNSSELRTDGLLKLKLFCRVLKVAKKKFQVHVYANCDLDKDENYSNQLCALRAKAVIKQIINDGFDSMFIEEVFVRPQGSLSDTDKQDTETKEDGVDIEAVPSKKDKSLNLSVSDLNTNKDIGTEVFLQDLDFEGGRHELLPEFIPVLDTLVAILKSNPRMEIKIIGHVCCTAFSDDGLDVQTQTKNLSYTRAKAVYKYLIAHHIKMKRLSYTGVGGSNKLVLPEITDQDKSLNRRVEIVIVKE
jgi:outer membrane protein OmpA-like peptidoglycan-associated protein